MSKKYKLYVNNDNLYGCQGTYKVMDGRGTVITDTTALTLDASGKTKIGEQTVADDDIAYWGGTKFTFTSVGAPTSVSGEIARNDYHYYDLSATPITYYFGNNFSMSFSLTMTEISGQSVSYPKTFSIATNENFTNAESVSFASAGTQSLHYTESNFGGDKGTGYLYIKDTENNAVYMFINTLKIFNKPTLTQTSISASGATYSVVFTATNHNDIACNLWTTNYTEAFTDQGTISANGTLSFTITSSSTTGIAHAYLKLDNVRSAENSKSWEYIKYTLTLHYYKDGTEDVSLRDTKSIVNGTEVSPVDYKKELSGYTYQDSVPNDSFIMNDNNSIQFNYISTIPLRKTAIHNPLTASELDNNYIYWDYESSSFCVKNVNSGNVIYNLIDADGSFPEDSYVYVKSGFDFILKFKTRSGSDVENFIHSGDTRVATTSPDTSSITDLNPGQEYSYTIHGLSEGIGFDFYSNDGDSNHGNIYIYIVE